jgi:hypothetical protein
MGKTTKLNPVYQTDGVKNNVIHSLSSNKAMWSKIALFW